MIPNLSQSLARDVLAEWSENLQSWSAAADHQQREFIDWSIGWLEGLSNPEKCRVKVGRLKDEMGKAMEESACDWLRLLAAQQEYFGEQLRKGGELLRAKSLAEAQSTVAALSASTQGLWRVSAHTAVRSSARLMRPMFQE